VAIPLPVETADALATYAAHVVPGERRPPAENLHLTVAFLGAVEASPGDVCARLRGAVARTEPLALHLDGVRLMPRRRPRMLWAAFGPAEPFAALAAKVAAVLEGLGSHRPEGRRARPHVTLARLRGPAPPEPLPEPPGEIPPLAVHAVELWQSFLSPRGPRYESLCDAPFGRA
jgi:2'-5' RNA ligase